MEKNYNAEPESRNLLLAHKINIHFVGSGDNNETDKNITRIEWDVDNNQWIIYYE